MSHLRLGWTGFRSENFIQMVATPKDERESIARWIIGSIIIIIIRENPDSLLHWAVYYLQRTRTRERIVVPLTCVIYRRCGTISTDNRSYLIAAKRSLLLSMMDRSAWTVSWEMMERDEFREMRSIAAIVAACCPSPSQQSCERKRGKKTYFEEIKRMPPSLIFSIVSSLDSLRNCQRHDRAAQFQLPVSSLSPYNKSFKEKIFPNLCVLYAVNNVVH